MLAREKAIQMIQWPMTSAEGLCQGDGTLEVFDGGGNSGEQLIAMA